VKFPLREGVISEDDVVGEIGQVVDEKLEGRASESDITIFDSTGFALQDSSTVPLEYEVRWPPGSASRRR
jgi:alanine dehydrogenase